jgi:guanyl-specific ribonuclease Sa
MKGGVAMKLSTKRLLVLLLFAVILVGLTVFLHQGTEPSPMQTPEPQQTETAPPAITPDTPPLSPSKESTTPVLAEDGAYTSKEDVALYIHLYGHLPPNFITKKEAKALGWNGGYLEPYAPGKCIGGNRFGNNEGLLPEAEGRIYTECDIDTLGAKKRGAKRIVFSNDGLVFYTEDHYRSFELLYGEDV